MNRVGFKENWVGFDDCHSIHVWSSSPRTHVLGHSQPSLRDWSRGYVYPGLTSWATLSRPYGTDRDKPLELICFQRVRYKVTAVAGPQDWMFSPGLKPDRC
jgi:hypothetical protein